MKVNKNIKCNYIYPYIVSEVSFSNVEEHLKDCKICSEQLEKIDLVMSILDEQVEVPADLAEKTIQKKTTTLFTEKPRFDYSKYLQIAAVLAIGIFLGIFLGKNANLDFLASKKYKKEKALIEYRESHLLYDSNSFYKL
ncbi:MAG: hypothetical protein WAO52_08440 [Prolixibacteraceae bacterium]